jgi:hypothetical protein
MTGFSERLGKAAALLGFRYGGTYSTLTSIIAYRRISKLHACRHVVMNMNQMLSHVLTSVPEPYAQLTSHHQLAR